MGKVDYDFISGNIKVKVKAVDDNDKVVYFEFECYCEDINSYDKMENIVYIAYHMGALRNLYRTEVVDVKKIKG